jgi:hypothetical protein
MIEQRGKCEGGKKPPSRSIKPEKSNFTKLDFYRAACQKDFFDRLKGRQIVNLPSFFVCNTFVTPILLKYKIDSVYSGEEDYI